MSVTPEVNLSLPAGYRVMHFSDIDSTNEEAKRQAAAGASAGLWLLAEKQSAGRGRHGRKWESGVGNLYASLLLYPACDLSHIPELSFVTAVAVAKTVGQFTKHAKITCKWPNDVLVNGAKIAGILLESESSGQPQKPYVIIGIGLNIRHHPKLADYPATCLADHTDTDSIAVVFEILATKLAEAVTRWGVDGFGPARVEWLNMADGKGKRITIASGTETLSGTFTGLGMNGALLLEDESGGLHEFVSGTILKDGN